MLYTVVVLHVMAYMGAIQGQLNITEKVRIAEMLQEMCPHASICRNNATTVNQNHTNYCCAACSCEADCDRDVPCCYEDDQDRYRGRVRTKCLLPQSKQTYGSHQHMYYMVGDRTNRGGCENAYVAPWGSIYPVASKSTGLIYRNGVCAERNSVTDFQLLEAHVVCMTDSEYDESFRSIEGYSEWPRACVVYFYVDTEVFARQKCSIDDMISTCPIHFEVPSYTNLSRNQLIEGCSSGLFSPYYNEKVVYANPFCMICGSGLRTSQCADDSGVFFRNLGVSYSYVLDFTHAGRTKWSSYKPTQDNTHVGVEACLPTTNHGESTVCREVRCPSGQVRDTKDGTCFFPAKMWYTYGFVVHLRLRPTQPIFISLNDTIQISQLKSPWPNSWYISKIFAKHVYDNSFHDAYDNSSYYDAYDNTSYYDAYDNTSYYDAYDNSSYYDAYDNTSYYDAYDNTSYYDAYEAGYDDGAEDRTYIHHFIVRLYTNQTHVNPNALFKAAELFIDSNWIFMTDSGSVELQSSLSIYNQWYQVPDTNSVMPMITFGTFDPSMLSIIYNEIDTVEQSGETIFYKPSIVLSRLHFCERIQLLPHEFNLTTEGMLYYIHRDRYLMDGEFTLSSTSNGDLNAYICLSDSSFVKNEGTDNEPVNIASRRSKNSIESLAMLLFVMAVNLKHI